MAYICVALPGGILFAGRLWGDARNPPVTPRRNDRRRNGVFFNQVITSGVYTASIGLCGNIGASAPGEITVIGRGLMTNGLFIQTYTSAGVLADRGFHVSVQF